MAITIPTGAFTRLLGNIAPFASPHDDMPDFNVVRLTWDGTNLNAAATDSVRYVRDTWPSKEFEGNSDTLFSLFGGADDYWCVFISLIDVVDLIRHFKLPAKQWNTPIVLDHHKGSLKVARTGALGHQDLTAVVLTHMVEFPAIDDILDAEPARRAVEEVCFAQFQMSDFCDVEADGPLHFTHCGLDRSTRVKIGDWFVGTIRPVSAESKLNMEILVGAV